MLPQCVVISCNRGDAYIITELDGSVFDRPVIPYFTRTKLDLDLPPLADLINISQRRLTEMENMFAVDPEDDDDEEYRPDRGSQIDVHTATWD